MEGDTAAEDRSAEGPPAEDPGRDATENQQEKQPEKQPEYVTVGQYNKLVSDIVGIRKLLKGRDAPSSGGGDASERPPRDESREETPQLSYQQMRKLWKAEEALGEEFVSGLLDDGFTPAQVAKLADKQLQTPRANSGSQHNGGTPPIRGQAASAAPPTSLRRPQTLREYKELRRKAKPSDGSKPNAAAVEQLRHLDADPTFDPTELQ